jgi:glycerol-3-phosphate acyltransferase PlsY
VLTLVLDALKGAAAILIARTALHYSGSWTIAAAAILVIIGHMYPIWLGFRGGKGVATGVGVFLLLAPIAVLGAGVVFLAIVVATRYVSLGSIVAAATIPMFVWLQHGLIASVRDLWPTMASAVVGALLIMWAHRSNIQRLLNGTESKFR